MGRIEMTAFAGVLASAIAAGATLAAPSGRIEVVTQDVTRFYKVYDAAGGHPTADQIQHDYLDPGSEGLHHLLKVRNVNAANIAKAIADRPQMYVHAKACMAVLPRVRARLDVAFHKLLVLYPEAQKPPVTILVSRGKPFAISGPGDGVQVSVEGLCSDIADKYLEANLEDRFVHVIAHEYIHSQQTLLLANNNDQPTVLERSLLEGAAEFMGKMISGDVASHAQEKFAAGHEKEIETRFAADIDKTDMSDWIDNVTPDNPGNLGYWIGARIVASYYQNATDKRAAIREILQMNDPHAFLAKSGWYPGIVLK